MEKEDLIQKILGLQLNEGSLSIGAPTEGSVEIPTEEVTEVRTDDLKQIENLADTLTENPPEQLGSENHLSECMLWHNRLGHPSLEYLKKLQQKEK